MQKECWDCYYSQPAQENFKYFCEKRRKTIYGDNIACSYFVSDDAKSCLDCYFSEANTSFFAKSDSYICTRNNKKVSLNDIAFKYFVED